MWALLQCFGPWGPPPPDQPRQVRQGRPVEPPPQGDRPDLAPPPLANLRLASESLSHNAATAPAGALDGLPLSPRRFLSQPQASSVSTKEEICAAFAQGGRRRRVSSAQRQRRRSELESHRQTVLEEFGQLAGELVPEDPPSYSAVVTEHPESPPPPVQQPAPKLIGRQRTPPPAPSRNPAVPLAGDSQTPEPPLAASCSRFFTPASELAATTSGSAEWNWQLYTTVTVMPSAGSSGMVEMTAAAGWGREAGAEDSFTRAVGPAMAGDWSQLPWPCTVGTSAGDPSACPSRATTSSSAMPLLGASSTRARRGRGKGRGGEPQESTASSEALSSKGVTAVAHAGAGLDENEPSAANMLRG